MTIAQLNRHAEAIDLDSMRSLEISAEMPASQIIGKICGIYQKVKPFLEFMSRLFFIPKKWKVVVLAFMTAMDTLCPTE
jgi:hypothetical protein